MFAHPASDEQSLRNYSDWNELVVTHELTHIFHLDRVRGIWRLGQDVFGRNPLLFPNIYDPAWVTEGLAVYYESRLTGVGRLESGDHFMVARAAALAREIPHLNQLSRGTSRYPGGEVVYIYGSLLFDYLSRTTRPEDVRKFVEKSSAFLIPFWINHSAKSGFGISFETAWRRWRDSLNAHIPAKQDPPGWRDLTHSGRAAFFPRWISSSAPASTNSPDSALALLNSRLFYSGSNGKEVPAVYEIDFAGHEKRLGRRNGVDRNAGGLGNLFFTQPDLTTPYEERSDLWVEHEGVQRRLTRGARIHSIDARRDGAIVGVQNLPATTRLVRVSPDGKNIVPLAGGSLDAQWSDPRWSPDGNLVAAIKLSRGRSELWLVHKDGGVHYPVLSWPAIIATPSWAPDGRHIYFSSELSGSSQLYVIEVMRGDTIRGGEQARRLTSVATGIFQPEPSPDGRYLAASLYRVDGYHIGIFPIPDFASLPLADSVRVSPRAECTDCVVRSSQINAADSAAASSLAIKSYSVFPTILPQFWLPNFQSSADNGDGFGAETGGTDVIGRHWYDVQFLHNTTHGDNSAWLYYTYAGLGTPLLGLTASQSYSRARLYKLSGTTAKLVGDLVEQSQVASVQTIFVRPRVRTYAAVALGAELERKSYITDPDTLLRHVSPIFQKQSTYPSVYLSGDWTNAKRPALSISAEDGISLSSTLRERWRSGATSGTSRSAVAALGGFKSLDLPGFAHHVLALRVAAGIADDRTPDRFSAGGVSGSSVSIISGYNVGGQRRTFGVRGYPAGAEAGIRAMSGSLEYRAPLFAPSRGFRFVPIFVDKVSAVLFGDAGRAYCPAASANGSGACLASDVGNPWMASVGAEVNVDTGFELDFIARLRLGVAIPTVNRQELRAPSSLFYATFGSSF